MAQTKAVAVVDGWSLPGFLNSGDFTEYAVPLGMLRYAVRSGAYQTERVGLGGFLGKLWGRS